MLHLPSPLHHLSVQDYCMRRTVTSYLPGQLVENRAEQTILFNSWPSESEFSYRFTPDVSVTDALHLGDG